MNYYVTVTESLFSILYYLPKTNVRQFIPQILFPFQIFPTHLIIIKFVSLIQLKTII